MNIEDYRKEIDRTDSEISRLFAERMNTVKKIGELKKEKALPVSDSERENKILSALCENVSPELAPYLTELYGKIFELSKRYQDAVKNYE